MLGVCASQISADFSPGRLSGGTVRQCCLREPQRTQRSQSLAFAPKLGLPALGRFPQFSAFDEVGETCMNIEAENSRNRPNMAFSPVTASRGRAPAFTCNRLQNTHDPLTTLLKRNAETRDRGLKTHGVIHLKLSAGVCYWRPVLSPRTSDVRC